MFQPRWRQGGRLLVIKTVLSGSFEFNDAVAALVPRHRVGVDAGWTEKRASSSLFDFSALQPRRNETFVHLLALGDGEIVGPNRNGDFFSRDANRKYHHTFKTAHFFRHHDNDDPAKSYGRVVEAAHNEAMGRVELVVGLDNEKCAEDLGIIEKNGFFECSMSARVPLDVCSVCRNKARTRSEYCKHASTMMGRILSDGRQVYVDNPDPTFFDISRVWRGADRVARTFRALDKAASANGAVIGGAELAEQLGVADPFLSKSAFFVDNRAVSEVFKDFLNVWPWAGSNASRAVSLTDAQCAFLKTAGTSDDIVGTLSDLGIVLSPVSLRRVYGQAIPDGADDAAIRASARAALYDGGRAKKACENPTYDSRGRYVPLPAGLADATAADLAFARFLGDISAGKARKLEKRAAAPFGNAVVDALGDEYLAYVISVGRRVSAAFPGREAVVRNLTAVRGLC